MLLYLTGKDKVNLLDFVENEIGILPKKMTGKFSLMQFVVKDMRNYVHMRYFVIDRAAVNEDENGFIQAVRSFQTMFNSRLIVIYEGCSPNDTLLWQLIEIGVTDIVTAIEIKEIQSEILECLSPEGMQRYKHPIQEVYNKETVGNMCPAKEQYHFTCRNIRIAVAGCQRRVGTTTAAINLAHWIQLHGGMACYVEGNSHNHLAYIVRLYCEQKEGKHDSIAGVDYYLNDKLDKDYNFIIVDCGELTEPPQTSFVNADIRILCGSAMPYELPYLQNAINLCKDLSLFVLGMYVPLDIQDLLCQSINKDIMLANPSFELFNGEINTDLNEKIVRNFIEKHKCDAGVNISLYPFYEYIQTKEREVSHES